IQTSVIGNERTLETKRLRLSALKDEIKKHKQYRSQVKAVGDDVLWDKIMGGKDLSALKGQKIYSEEFNPVYRKLESEIAELSVDTAFLSKELVYLKAQQEKLYKDVETLASKVADLKMMQNESSRAYTIAKTRYDSLFSRIT
ncbi:MAG: hypothetical protein COZ72_03700, partial [Elusimicrobia bacterium CG_4_8_14_3_um_filter_50_9]